MLSHATADGGGKKMNPVLTRVEIGCRGRSVEKTYWMLSFHFDDALCRRSKRDRHHTGTAAAADKSCDRVDVENPLQAYSLPLRPKLKTTPRTTIYCASCYRNRTLQIKPTLAYTR